MSDNLVTLVPIILKSKYVADRLCKPPRHSDALAKYFSAPEYQVQSTVHACTPAVVEWNVRIIVSYHILLAIEYLVRAAFGHPAPGSQGPRYLLWFPRTLFTIQR
jgi:hypothetical protein